VAGACIRCVGVGQLGWDGRLVLGGDLVPEDFARVAVEAVDFPAIDGVRRLLVAAAAAEAAWSARSALGSFRVLPLPFGPVFALAGRRARTRTTGPSAAEAGPGFLLLVRD